MQKRIIIIINSLTGGGAEKIVTMLLHKLSRKKYLITLLVFTDNFQYFIPEDIEIIILNKKKIFGYILIIFRLKKIFTQKEPFCIISFLFRVNLVTIIAKKLSKVNSALIISERNNLTSSIMKSKIYWRIAGSYLIKKLYPLSTAIITPSKGVKKDLVDNFNIKSSKIHMIYNGIDIREISEAAREIPDHGWYQNKNYPIIIGMGRLVKHKGFFDLINAFAEVSRYIKCYLVILGEGKELGNLKNLCKNLKIEKEVSFPGFQNNPYPFLSHSDIFVLPSYFEGFPNVILEAMVCGVPVISTKCHYGPEELITNNVNGILIPVGNKASLVSSLKKLINSEQLRYFLSENAKDRSSSFKIENMISDYERIIDCNT
jgi:glycosyltransferase involved in cell wall biosynthesis